MNFGWNQRTDLGASAGVGHDEVGLELLQAGGDGGGAGCGAGLEDGEAAQVRGQLDENRTAARAALGHQDDVGPLVRRGDGA